MSHAKGDRNERLLVNLLDESGFAVMRAPASGSSTDRELPDVLAGNGESFHAIEAKSSSGDPIYLTEEEVEALVFFADNFGATPQIGVKFDVKHGDPAYGNDSDSGWRFLRPGDCYRTPGGNYRVKKETALSDGDRLSSLIGGHEVVE